MSSYSCGVAREKRGRWPFFSSQTKSNPFHMLFGGKYVTIGKLSVTVSEMLNFFKILPYVRPKVQWWSTGDWLVWTKCCPILLIKHIFQNLSFGSVIATFFDYLPCFLLSLVFRLFSLAMLMSYLQVWTAAIVFFYFILNMLISMKPAYSHRRYETSGAVLAFMSIFIPVFYIKNMDGLDPNRIDDRVYFLFLQYR